jgi:hypothetical protein
LQASGAIRDKQAIVLLSIEVQRMFQIEGPRHRMQDDPEKREGRWWRRGRQTRLHVYYEPTSNVQGILLFSLLAILGAIAVIIAGIHDLQTHSDQHENRVLGGIGLFCLVLALVQIRNLMRASK